MDPSLTTSQQVTQALNKAAGGDRNAVEQLMPLVYDELRALAASALRRERANHTLQPTALVNEAFLRLIDQTHAAYNSKTHFFAVGAQMIRRVLVDHARKHLADKRGGGADRLTLSGIEAQESDHQIDLLALDDAMMKLAKLDERQARVVELRYFGGLGVDETARMLDVSPRTVDDDWRMAKAWLKRELS